MKKPDKIYITYVYNHGLKVIAASHKQSGLKSKSVALANEQQPRIGIVKRELCYIEYKTSDIEIMEVPLI